MIQKSTTPSYLHRLRIHSSESPNPSTCTSNYIKISSSFFINLCLEVFLRILTSCFLIFLPGRISFASCSLVSLMFVDHEINFMFHLKAKSINCELNSEITLNVTIFKESSFDPDEGISRVRMIVYIHYTFVKASHLI